MAQFDLKHAHVFLRDGYTGLAGAQSAVVNHAAGYAQGANTMVIGGVTGIIPSGDWFTVAGDTVEHQIVSHTETGPNTTSITFSPPLGAAVIDTAPLTWLRHSLEIKVGEGTLDFTEKRNIVYVKDRGLLSTVREGDQDPTEVKLDLIWEFLRSTTSDIIPTPEEALKKLGPASNWASSSPDPCEPYCIDIVCQYQPPCPAEMEIITLNEYRYESLEHNAKQGTLSTSGKCNVVMPTVTRVSA